MVSPIVKITITMMQRYKTMWKTRGKLSKGKTTLREPSLDEQFAITSEIIAI